MKPKKYLGQHFLKNKNVARKIIEAADVNKDDIVLEVGPGRGALTEFLVQRAKKVIAIEKDKELTDFLMDKFSAEGGKRQKKLIIIHGDILKLKNKKLKIKKYKIVANIPYYITSRFLRQFLESDFQPSLMVLMVQKEVAERIIARDKKESILSISVKAYGQPRIIAKVPAKNFSPMPKVDSAIILIDKISKDFFNNTNIHDVGRQKVNNKINEGKFFQLVRHGFAHKRKMLKNNLKISAETLQKCKIPALNRAEELSLKDWNCLYQSIEVQPQ
jgi:16S rRNA (adenine1518-N6/adenine1519-N6)-dimethyltransferase